jgi:hypothetical protein
MAREPITTDRRISFVTSDGRHVVYDRPTNCCSCRNCLADEAGRCAYGGPYLTEPLPTVELKEAA